MRGLAAALTLLLAFVGAPAIADQNDPRLNGLFEDLKAAPDFETGREIEDEIWKIWLEHPDDRTREAVLIGMSFLQKGQAQLAELSFNEAIDRHPDFAEAWNKRATFNFLKGDIAASIADCAHVLKLEPRHFGALSGLGLMYAQLQKWDAAVHWYQQALEIHPNLPGIRAGLKEAKRRLEGEET